MSTDRDPTRIVRSWLRTDGDDDASGVLDAVFERIDTIPQRRATRWPSRRFPEMNTTLKLALGAAAVVAVALLGIRFLVPGTSSFGAPDPTVTVTATPAPSPAALGEGVLEPGTYIAHPLASNPSLAVTFTVPDGWEAFGPSGVLPVEGSGGPSGMAMGFFDIGGLYSDPCNSLGAADVEAGTTAAELATAFSRQTAYETSVEDVTFAGYTGKQVELQLPSDLDPATCPYDEYFVFDVGPYSQGPGNRWHLTVLDVEESRLVIFAQDFAGTSAADRAELQSMLDSIQIDPGEGG